MRSRRLRTAIAAMGGGVLLALLLTIFVGGASSAGIVGAGTATPKNSVCGLGSGKKATGAPIVMGGIYTKNPGIDFSPIGSMANAYFQCVNANGGIHGRPIKYIIYTEADQPDLVASLPVKLANSDHVVAIVGNTSDTDCIINHKYYEQNHFNVIVAGVPNECFTTPNIAAVNMGPHYSNIGAAQALVHYGAKSIVAEASNVPGANPYYNSGAVAVGQAAGLRTASFYEDVPIQDANSVVQKIVQQAGDGGGADFALIPPEGLKVMLAAQQQNLITKIHWSGATPFNSAFIATSIGKGWNGNFLVNAEFNLLNSTGPDEQLYLKLKKKYYPTCDACEGSFGQMGFMIGKVMTYMLLALPANQLTRTGINAAIPKIKNFQSDIWCKPWYFGKLAYHIPNNTDRTVVPQNGVFVQKDACFPIQAVDKALTQTRKWETQFKLNSGTSWPPVPGQPAKP
jgi:branched-chain amino acid transport system substrate-binding protein